MHAFAVIQRPQTFILHPQAVILSPQVVILHPQAVILSLSKGALTIARN